MFKLIRILESVRIVPSLFLENRELVLKDILERTLQTLWSAPEINCITLLILLLTLLPLSSLPPAPQQVGTRTACSQR
jgi:hypothetical protein